jgi:hypothetical protein
LRLAQLDPSNLLRDPKRAVAIHTWLWRVSFLATIAVMATPALRNAVWLVQFISWYAIWFMHIDGKQAALAHLEAAQGAEHQGADGKP